MIPIIRETTFSRLEVHHLRQVLFAHHVCDVFIFFYSLICYVLALHYPIGYIDKEIRIENSINALSSSAFD